MVRGVVDGAAKQRLCHFELADTGPVQAEHGQGENVVLIRSQQLLEQSLGLGCIACLERLRRGAVKRIAGRSLERLLLGLCRFIRPATTAKRLTE